MKKRSMVFGLILCVVLSAFGPAFTASAAGIRANPTGSVVILNGRELTCAAYNIGGNNYFKLRDLMNALNISVNYDGISNTIIIDTSKGYTPNGSESKNPVKFPTDEAAAATAKITLDGQPVYWTAYNIYGNNFFKLRDIGEAINFSVVFDSDNDKVLIDTSRGYDPDETIHTQTAEAPAPTMTIDEIRAEFIRLTNAERVIAGAPELEILPELMNCAQAKAQDFLDSNYYGHTSPVYGTFGEMIKSFVPNARSAAENIAPWRQTPQEVIAEILESPEHLKNMLNPKYTHIGVGIVEGANGGYWWVQQFVSLG